ncbi:MAG: glutamate--cysteine ligase [Granulosicoccus sp.]|nr:glutamate--cysteine ligase [Granulosicoccus sp.]
MFNVLQDRLKQLQGAATGSVVDGRLVGVEKESLRVSSDGSLSQLKHPESLGAALTHPHITTDYSEALLEVVTPPMDDVPAAVEFLQDVHRFIYPRLPADETIWATSMPCVVSGDDSIPVGVYGNSNAGKMKHVYRRGLGLRYGKTMQTIAGVHFNYSWPKAFWPIWQDLCESQDDLQGFITEQYFQVTRNLLQFGWLVPYLFGASPAVCNSFLGDAAQLPGMRAFKKHTVYEPFGTSLRMGDIGYQYRKDAAEPIHVSYNDMESYIDDLHRLITRPHPEYSSLGVTDADGRIQQLNTNVLQIENEYYSSVRPKQIPDNGEMPLLAMARRGIRYLELRSVDVDVFEPVGVSHGQLHFLEVFMLFSLLHDSPEFDPADIDKISANMSSVAHRGRDPELTLHRGDQQVPLVQWGLELIDAMTGVAEMLDKHTGTTLYTATLQAQKLKFQDSELTPSARVLREMKKDYDSFYEFARAWSLKHNEALSSPANSAVDDWLTNLAQQSHADQRALEASDSGSFEHYLENYFKQLDSADLAALVAKSA